MYCTHAMILGPVNVCILKSLLEFHTGGFPQSSLLPRYEKNSNMELFKSDILKLAKSLSDIKWWGVPWPLYHWGLDPWLTPLIPDYYIIRYEKNNKMELFKANVLKLAKSLSNIKTLYSVEPEPPLLIWPTTPPCACDRAIIGTCPKYYVLCYNCDLTVTSL